MLPTVCNYAFDLNDYNYFSNSPVIQIDTLNVLLCSCDLGHLIFAHMSSFADHFRAATLKNLFFLPYS